MNIRRLHTNDLAALLTIYQHLHATDAPLPSLATVESVWAELISSANFYYYGGFLREELVSSCTLAVIPNLTRGCSPYGLVENVVTHTDHRRNGYARRLLEKTLKDAWSANCYKVMLLTGRKNEATLRFYEGVGFDRHAKQAFVAVPPESQ